MTVHICPVCNGRGTVPAGFYSSGNETIWSGDTDSRETCRSCGGKGVIITPEARYYPPWRPDGMSRYPPPVLTP